MTLKVSCDIILLVSHSSCIVFFRFVLCRNQTNRNYSYGSDGMDMNISNPLYRARKSTASDIRNEGTTTCRDLFFYFLFFFMCVGRFFFYTTCIMYVVGVCISAVSG